jgi:hypothetical protein
MLINSFFLSRSIDAVSGCQSDRRACEANGLAGAARRISEAGGDSRMRVFNFGVTVVALIVLTILIGWLSTTWLAFEKSRGLTLS